MTMSCHPDLCHPHRYWTSSGLRVVPALLNLSSDDERMIYVQDGRTQLIVHARKNGGAILKTPSALASTVILWIHCKVTSHQSWELCMNWRLCISKPRK